ncbi:kinase-like protein [Penicillium lagena]|uniref:kinase-like protein n=1 Tax=Penicillium lagena TaxID=94218 RepID=UPI00253FC24C|nr:kinase-like protein [Penicillium lagena]KAJ5625722.1 kinase-like protein [Penicillium lagena]
MPSKGGLYSFSIFWTMNLGFLYFIFITLAYGAPTSDLDLALPSRPNTETELLYALSRQDELDRSPLVKRGSSPDLYAKGWLIGPDSHGNTIYAFGSNENSLPKGIVKVGKKINAGGAATILQASLLTFNRPRAVGKNTASRSWGGNPVGNEAVQYDLVAKDSYLSLAYKSVHIMEMLEPSKTVPRVYKALLVPADEDYCGDNSENGSIVVMEKLYKDAASMLRRYNAARARHDPQYRLFNRLIMMQQFVKGLDYAHDLGIAHKDAHLGNLMSTFQPDQWKIIDWDFSTDYGRKPKFAGDVENAGLSLLYAGVPRLQERIYQRRLTSILSKPRSPTNVKETLEDLFDLEGYDEFLTLVGKTTCEQSKRLTMKEFYSELQNFEANDLPFIE